LLTDPQVPIPPKTLVRRTWKEVAFGFVNLLVVVLAIVAVQLALRKHVPAVVAATLAAVLCFGIYRAGSKWIERRIPGELAARRALPEGAAGFVLGLALFAAVIGILWAMRVYHPAGRGAANRLALGFLFAVSAGVVEEIVFRGLLFRLSAKILGTWGALLFTAGLFGAAHAFNPGATVSSSLAIALEAGILLGAAYAATTRLWLPIGLHIGWNFTEGWLFGMSVSGGAVTGGLIQGSLSGPRILTGGRFGPEASIVAVVVALAAAMYFIRRIVTLRRAQPPVWSRPARD
jgi:CAAX protease family protein